MFRQFLLVVAIASLTLSGEARACCHDDARSGAAAARAETAVAPPLEALLDEIVGWLASNFDLPASKERPAVEFVSTMTLATIHARDVAHSHGLAEGAGTDRPDERRVV